MISNLRPLMSSDEFERQLAALTIITRFSFILPIYSYEFWLSRSHPTFFMNRSSLKKQANYHLNHAGNVKLPVPYNLTIRKGSLNVALSREFVDSMSTDQVALDLFNWMYDMTVPDESFFPTLVSTEKHENGTVVQNLDKNTTHGLVSKFHTFPNN